MLDSRRLGRRLSRRKLDLRLYRRLGSRLDRRLNRRLDRRRHSTQGIDQVTSISSLLKGFHWESMYKRRSLRDCYAAYVGS
jgi:hypothetical protein